MLFKISMFFVRERLDLSEKAVEIVQSVFIFIKQLFILLALTFNLDCVVLNLEEESYL